MARKESMGYAKRAINTVKLFIANGASEEELRADITELFEDYIAAQFHRKLRLKPDETQITAQIKALILHVQQTQYDQAIQLAIESFSDIRVAYLIKTLILEIQTARKVSAESTE